MEERKLYKGFDAIHTDTLCGFQDLKVILEKRKTGNHPLLKG
jgi:hypothetical protein